MEKNKNQTRVKGYKYKNTHKVNPRSKFSSVQDRSNKGQGTILGAIDRSHRMRNFLHLYSLVCMDTRGIEKLSAFLRPTIRPTVAPVPSSFFFSPPTPFFSPPLELLKKRTRRKLRILCKMQREGGRQREDGVQGRQTVAQPEGNL